jgi:hypothetical protein
VDGDGGIEGVEVYDTAGDYVLGSRDDDRYAIWDDADPSTPIATFAGDDRGLEQAEQLLLQLARARSHQTIPRFLLIATVAAFGLWVVAGLVRQILVFSSEQATFGVSQGSPGIDRTAEVFAIVETTAFRLAIVALATSAALWLFASLRREG